MPPVRSKDEEKKGVRKSSRVKQKERDKQREAWKIKKSKGAEQIQTIQAKILEAEKRLRDVEDDNVRHALESSLSTLKADYEKRKSDLLECDTRLDEIDQEDKMDIDEDNGEDIPSDTENGAEEFRSTDDQTESPNAISDTGPNSATESSEETAPSAGVDESGLQEAREHDQARSSEEGSTSSTGSNDNVPLRDPQEPGETLPDEDGTPPHSFIQCIPASSNSKNNNGDWKFSLENGWVIMEAQEGKLNLNKYGPNNSAIYIWSGTPAASRVGEMTSLHGLPHKDAVDTDNVHGGLKWKYKITAIRSVAWKPKKVCDSMLSVLDSVEELNPANKISNSRYVYPFSCAFVDLVDGENRATVCITRSDYKRLSKGGKESHAKIDRKFYLMACGQVERYRNWAGKDLDPKWNGQARIGRDDRDLTPMDKTPEPEMIPEPSTPETSTPEPSTPEPSTPEPPTLGNSTVATPRPSKDNNKSGDGENSQATVPISKCYKAFLGKNKIAKGTPLESLEEKEQLYWAFIAAAEIWMMQLKKSNVKVIDDMELEGILEI